MYAGAGAFDEVLSRLEAREGGYECFFVLVASVGVRPPELGLAAWRTWTVMRSALGALVGEEEREEKVADSRSRVRRGEGESSSSSELVSGPRNPRRDSSSASSRLGLKTSLDLRIESTARGSVRAGCE